MDQLTMWGLIIGFISSTFIIPVIQQPHWNSRVRALVTFGYCILVGLGNVYFTGQFNVQDIVTSILTVLISAIAIFKGFVQPTGIGQAIEEATSIKPPTEV